jgi:nucleotide-binding universal stress UspA family protein
VAVVAAFKNIVCAFDFSACSRDALAKATDIAARSDAALTIVHVWNEAIYNSPQVPSGDVIAGVIRDTDRAIADCVATARAAGVNTVRSTIANGQASDEIVGIAANDPTIDLIVMGTHGRTGLERVFLGSVAEHVVRHARCAVLVVR